jgi:hypothetical protein
MVRRLLISLALLLMLAVAGASAVYAYDESHDEVVAEGVAVAGIDIGGLRADVARALVASRLAPLVHRPLTLDYRRQRFTLPPIARAEVGEMVAEALARSRDAPLPIRVFRAVTGRPVHTDVALRVTYSREAVESLVAGIRQRVNRPPREARLIPSALRLRTIRSRDGVAVRPRTLLREIAARLRHPDAPSLLQVPTRAVEPRTTTRELAKRNPFFITISRDRKQLRLWRRLRLAKLYRVAVGQIAYATPAGRYHVRSKVINPAWQVPEQPWAGSLAGRLIPGGVPENPLKARWMGFYKGAGIHGTDDVWSLGSAASHGCIRMSIPDVIQLYNRVPLRTPVYIA